VSVVECHRAPRLYAARNDGIVRRNEPLDRASLVAAAFECARSSIDAHYRYKICTSRRALVQHLVGPCEPLCTIELNAAALFPLKTG
jgi:hypothetical protein